LIIFEGESCISCAGLCVLRLTFSTAWLRNFVAACGLARSTAAYGGLRRRLWGLCIHVVTMCVLIGHCAGNSNYRPTGTRQAQHMCHVVSAIIHG